MEPAPAPGLMISGLDAGEIAVVGTGDAAEKVAAALTARGFRATVVVDAIRPDAAGVIFLGGLDPVTSEMDAIAVSEAAFAAAKAVAGRLEDGPGLFVTVQDTGGDFGSRGAEPIRAWLGGIAALARTAAREWPHVGVRAIDIERGGRTTDAIASAIVTELVTGGATVDVGLRADGSRWGVTTTRSPIDSARESTTDPVAHSTIGPDSVVLATGGARGITAAALTEWARTHRPRIVLVGRTQLTDESGDFAGEDSGQLKRALVSDHHRRTGKLPTPTEISARVAHLTAVREIRSTIAALEAAGSPVRYVCADVTDADAMSATLAPIRAEWGPIDVVVHGAGVLADGRIANKTSEQFSRVFDTKVRGLRAILDVVANDPVRVLCLFSSVSARFGNAGQSDYAMANETLNQVSAAFAARNPELLSRAIGWGAWAGGMVDATLADHFAARGVELISMPAGARAFGAELAGSGRREPQVLIAPAGQVSLDGAVPIRHAAVQTSRRTHPQLSDHAIAGTVVLPQAQALEWLLRMAGTDRLRDSRVLRKISLADDDRFALRLDGTAVTLHAGGPVPSYRAVVATGGRAGDWSPPALEQFTESDVYDGRVLFHGPMFQALRALAPITDRGAAARAVGADDLNWPADSARTDVALMDACLQLAVLWAERVTGSATLPMGVGDVAVYQPGRVRGPANVLVRAGGLHADRVECDAAIVSDDARVVAELLKISLVRRPR